VATLDELNKNVTSAILFAEGLPENAPERPAAFREVSQLEEEIASVTRANGLEGGIARLGAVSAALTALDLLRAIQLGEGYLLNGLEPDIEDRLQALLKTARALQAVETAARFLAAELAEDHPELGAVYWIPHETETWLIEITEACPTRGEVYPFRLVAAPPEAPFLRGSVCLHPDDWEHREMLDWGSLNISQARRLFSRSDGLGQYDKRTEREYILTDASGAWPHDGHCLRFPSAAAAMSYAKSIGDQSELVVRYQGDCSEMDGWLAARAGIVVASCSS